MNNVFRETRELPVLELLDYIWCHQMAHHYKRQTYALTLPSTDSDYVAKHLKVFTDNCVAAWTFKVTPSVHLQALVEGPGGDKYDVMLDPELKGGMCSCRFFQQYLVPCAHAIAACYEFNQAPGKYFDKCYLNSTLQEAYQVPYPMVLLSELDLDTALDPPQRKMHRGRPATVRKEPGAGPPRQTM
ncbi:hypothetical protein DACRYDRAFT_20299 [Dacryopinax primogenitus]|uniref:SWIM-type domain-containing protein n=1 Tax=Dacryopinax primogenitus (strain DJM 731) TaxID=1858805 RepID=M5GDK8_DACPD|nr:uncharacterized protein DACRYDRAFT_20299 [Dacryopinax primogenitus]EJU04607.1 hypothetical protein DACRYDRAFT_20299 [Dacryopinax primogenitus]